MRADEAKTEKNPLLPKNKKKDVKSVGSLPIDPGAAISPEGPDEAFFHQHSDYDNGAEVERQVSDDDPSKQYQGMPEVKQRLKYIFPALAIGVSISYCIELRKDWDRPQGLEQYIVDSDCVRKPPHQLLQTITYQNC